MQTCRDYHNIHKPPSTFVEFSSIVAKLTPTLTEFIVGIWGGEPSEKGPHKCERSKCAYAIYAIVDVPYSIHGGLFNQPSGQLHMLRHHSTPLINSCTIDIQHDAKNSLYKLTIIVYSSPILIASKAKQLIGHMWSIQGDPPQNKQVQMVLHWKKWPSKMLWIAHNSWKNCFNCP